MKRRTLDLKKWEILKLIEEEIDPIVLDKTSDIEIVDNKITITFPFFKESLRVLDSLEYKAYCTIGGDFIFDRLTPIYNSSKEDTGLSLRLVIRNWRIDEYRYFKNTS